MTNANETKWLVDGEGPFNESSLRKTAKKHGLVEDNETMPIEDLIDWILECYPDVESIEQVKESENTQ